ncbi:MAG TPA: hypothetical protein VGC79_32440, partial [Polyangiaceae bacterium]
GQSIACACVNGLSGAQLCGDDGRYQPCMCVQGMLASFRTNMVGHWVGSRTSPWEQEPVSVTLDFKADGTWAGSCVGEDCSIFYYGSSVETSENRYYLSSVNDDQIAFGRLALTWGPGDSTEGDLRRIRFESDQTELLFEFWATWGGDYGPVSFTLHREP